MLAKQEVGPFEYLKIEQLPLYHVSAFCGFISLGCCFEFCYFCSKRTYLLELIVEITLTEGNIETLGDISFTSIKEREPFPDLKLIKTVFFFLVSAGLNHLIETKRV
jgi:hypothetical protein